MLKGPKVHGLAQLQAQLEELGAVTGQKVLLSAARKAFKPVLETAKQLAPVDTGMLRDNIRIATAKPKAGKTVGAVGLVISKDFRTPAGSDRPPAYASPHWRWHFVERGTSKMHARPFLRPALARNGQKVLDLLKTLLAKEIQRAVKKKAKAGK